MTDWDLKYRKGGTGWGGERKLRRNKLKRKFQNNYNTLWEIRKTLHLWNKNAKGKKKQSEQSS